jgi:hypothetical protein
MTITETSPNQSGYRGFCVGGFTFTRDEYYATIAWPTGTHQIAIDSFLRCVQRDVAWGFFYGIVNFDSVIGTMNHYGNVDLFAGRFNEAYRKAEVDYNENFDHDELMSCFKAMLSDWTNEGYDPFAAPMETGLTWIGKKTGHNSAAIERTRDVCRRMVGLPGDIPLRTDRNRYPVNRAFLDVPQDEPEIHAAPGFEGEVHAFNLFAYLSRSDVTWNPSVSSVCKQSLFCPTTEEYILPVKHANDRVEWFLQLSDRIEWQIEDGVTGLPRAKIVMRPGDVAAMPADIRHQGFARKRAMLLVWENADPELPRLHAQGAVPSSPAQEFWPDDPAE